MQKLTAWYISRGYYDYAKSQIVEFFGLLGKKEGSRIFVPEYEVTREKEFSIYILDLLMCYVQYLAHSNQIEVLKELPLVIEKIELWLR